VDFHTHIAAGSVSYGGAVVAVTGATLTHSAADATNPRFDLIAVDVDGSVDVVAGTPAANPLVPAVDDVGDIPIAAVYIPANGTTIGDHQIGDRRQFAPTSGLNPQTKPTNLTDSTTGAVTATLKAVRSDTGAHTASDAQDNFASLNAQLNTLQAALVSAGILV
jgi:hypothetical protein